MTGLIETIKEHNLLAEASRDYFKQVDALVAKHGEETAFVYTSPMLSKIVKELQNLIKKELKSGFKNSKKDGEVVYDTKDQTKKEIVEFLEQLNTKQFADVQNFFDTMPKLKHEVTIKNPKTKVESKVTLSGLNDFFA
jgi:glutamyl/glutaminyl-tRNA synthetase